MTDPAAAATLAALEAYRAFKDAERVWTAHSARCRRPFGACLSCDVLRRDLDAAIAREETLSAEARRLNAGTPAPLEDAEHRDAPAR